MTDDDTAQEIAEIEADMADDFAGYQGDTAKQERYGQLLQAREAGTVAPAKPDADSVRRDELVKLMADQRSIYWKGSQSDKLQQEYRDLLGAERPPAQGAGAARAQAVQVWRPTPQFFG